jgi:tetratricopeptide (TPR) repeat protein
VERAIRLAPIAEAGLKEGVNESITWTVHPAILNDGGADLKVVVAHRPKEAGEWVQLYDDLSPSASCVFTIPPADAESHRIKVTLVQRGKVIGEDVSAPLRIAGSPARPKKVDPQVVEVKGDSLYRSERGELQFETYRSVRAQYAKWFAEATAGLKRDAAGNIPASEIEKLSPEIRRQAAERERALDEAAQKIRENFQKAFEIDPRNYRAAYGMAQLLHRTAPDRPDEAIRWLEKCVAVKPDHAAAYNDLGATRILKGDYEGAEEPLRQALTVEDAGSFHYNLALSLFHQRKTAEARRQFEEALAKGGSAVKSGEVYYYLVAAYLQEGQGEEARRRLGLYRDQIPPALAESLAAAMKTR